MNSVRSILYKHWWEGRRVFTDARRVGESRSLAVDIGYAYAPSTSLESNTRRSVSTLICMVIIMLSLSLTMHYFPGFSQVHSNFLCTDICGENCVLAAGEQEAFLRRDSVPTIFSEMNVPGVGDSGSTENFLTGDHPGLDDSLYNGDDFIMDVNGPSSFYDSNILSGNHYLYNNDILISDPSDVFDPSNISNPSNISDTSNPDAENTEEEEEEYIIDLTEIIPVEELDESDETTESTDSTGSTETMETDKTEQAEQTEPEREQLTTLKTPVGYTLKILVNGENGMAVISQRGYILQANPIKVNGTYVINGVKAGELFIIAASPENEEFFVHWRAYLTAETESEKDVPLSAHDGEPPISVRGFIMPDAEATIVLEYSDVDPETVSSEDSTNADGNTDAADSGTTGTRSGAAADSAASAAGSAARSGSSDSTTGAGTNARTDLSSGPNVGPSVTPNITPSVTPNVGPNITPSIVPNVVPSASPSVPENSTRASSVSTTVGSQAGDTGSGSAGELDHPELAVLRELWEQHELREVWDRREME